jgi:hypothetical protein
MHVKSKYEHDDGKKCHIKFKNFLSYRFVNLTNFDKNVIIEKRYRPNHRVKMYNILEEASRILNGEKFREVKYRVDATTFKLFKEHQIIRFILDFEIYNLALNYLDLSKPRVLTLLKMCDFSKKEQSLTVASMIEELKLSGSEIRRIYEYSQTHSGILSNQ